MKKEDSVRRFRLNHWVVFGIIFFSVFLLYGNTIGNQYCLDDSVVITRNRFVDKGLSGISDIFSTESFTGFFGKQKELVSGSRYRPLSITTFAVEKQIFQEYKPSVSHFINILLFAITGFFIYLLLKKLVQFKKPVFEYVPLISTFLFIFHPIHTEVVANIKGRDEILALLFSLAGCFSILKYTETKKPALLITGAVLWFLGLLSKENAIVFWVLLPLILFLFGVRDKKKFILPMLAFSVPALVFLAIRHAVIGGSTGVSDELMNDSFLLATSQQRYATIFYTLWKYIELLFFPVHLTYDYYPYHIALTDWGNLTSLIGLVVYIALIIWMFLSVWKNPLITFALAFYLLPLLLVSNLFFPIGTFMSERFVYFSSVGFCILVSMGLAALLIQGNTWKYIVFLALGMVLLLYGIKVISRNNAWYNDYTLFTTDVKTSFNSAKSNCSAGGVLLESADTVADSQRKIATINQSINYLKKSVTIHPKYLDAWLLLGNAYFKKEIGIDSVLLCYTTILNDHPEHDLAFKNMQALVNREKNVDNKIFVLDKMVSYQPNNYQVNYQLGKLYGKEKNDLDKSIIYLTKAMVLNPNEKEVYVDLGVAYGFKRNFAKSADMLQKALAIDPNDANGFINLGVTYQNLGLSAKAAECFKRAEALKREGSKKEVRSKK